MDKVAVLIPCYYEGKTINKMVRDWREFEFRLQSVRMMQDIKRRLPDEDVAEREKFTC